MRVNRLFENDQLAINVVMDKDGAVKGVNITLRDGTVLVDDDSNVKTRYLTLTVDSHWEEKEKASEVFEDFDTALMRFIEFSQEVVDNNMKQFPGQHKKLVLMKGRRYIRVVSDDGTQSSAWAFVDTTNGDILKPASWKAPAKHARGNIFNAEYTLTPWGPPYLK